VSAFSSNVPYMDDWEFVPPMTGAELVSLRWLWSQHNEHRIVLSRLCLMAFGHISTEPFRLALFFNVALLSGEAIALLAAVRAVRGRLIWADAFIPLVVLDWGQYQTLLWSITLQNVWSSFLAACLLVLMPRIEHRASGVSFLLAGLCLVCLPLC